jgi:hypothetical protein
MNATAKRVLGIIGIVVIAGLCYLWGHHTGQQETIRQVKMALLAGKTDPAWVTRWEKNNWGVLGEWITLMIHKGTNAPYWSFDNGKALNQPEFERILGKMEQYGAGELFLYGEEDVTVQQVELTLDILRAHSVTNILMFTRVQGVIEPPFEMPADMMKEVEAENTGTNRAGMIKF